MTKRQVTGLMLLGVAGIAGVIFSGLLFYASVDVAAGAGSKMCSFGEKLDCSPALASRFSNVAGIPLPVISGAFYFSVLGLLLGVLFGTNDENREEWLLGSARYLVLTFGVALVATVVLAVITITQLSAACPFCMGLYAASVVGAIGTFLLGPQVKEMGGIGGGLRSALSVRPVHSALIVFVIASGIAYFQYQAEVDKASQASEEDARRKGEAVADELTLEGDVPIKYDGLPHLGPADAPVKIVEFSDFMCPHCMKFSDTVHQLHKQFPDDLAIYFNHYPLDGTCNPRAGDLHPSACLAATTATCAQLQGKFWEMHDALFGFYAAARKSGDHGDLDDAGAIKLATILNLNLDEFSGCLKDRETRGIVVEQVVRGLENEVQSTPSWFINGHRQKGAQSAAYITPLVDRLIKLHKSKATDATEPSKNGAPETAPK